MLIIDSSNVVIAQTTDPAYVSLPGYVTIESPDDFEFEQAREWAWNGTALVRDPALVLARNKAQRLSELEAYRYEKETAGITVNGALIRTDEYSQGKINGAWSTAQINPAVLIDFKGVNGWVKLNAAEITAIAEAVSIHVQSCFSTERIHSDAIAALETSEAVTAYDLNTGWPR